jgi:hypothetical protein
MTTADSLNDQDTQFTFSGLHCRGFLMSYAKRGVEYHFPDCIMDSLRKVLNYQQLFTSKTHFHTNIFCSL